MPQGSKEAISLTMLIPLLLPRPTQWTLDCQQAWLLLRTSPVPTFWLHFAAFNRYYITLHGATIFESLFTLLQNTSANNSYDQRCPPFKNPGLLMFDGEARMALEWSGVCAIARPLDIPLASEYEEVYLPSKTTNNVAEYTGLIRAIQQAKAMHIYKKY